MEMLQERSKTKEEKMCFRPSDTSVVELPLICPECGQENAPGEKKCMFCGAELPDEPVAAAPASPAAPKAPGAPVIPGAPAAPKPAGGIPSIPAWKPAEPAAKTDASAIPEIPSWNAPKKVEPAAADDGEKPAIPEIPSWPTYK